MKPRTITAIATLPLDIAVVGLILESASNSDAIDIVGAVAAAAFAYVIYVLIPFAGYTTLRRSYELTLSGRTAKATVLVAIFAQLFVSAATNYVTGSPLGLRFSLAVSTLIFLCVVYLGTRPAPADKALTQLKRPNLILVLYFGLSSWVFEIVPALGTTTAAYFACSFSFTFAYYFASASIQDSGT